MLLFVAAVVDDAVVVDVVEAVFCLLLLSSMLLFVAAVVDDAVVVDVVEAVVVVIREIKVVVVAIVVVVDVVDDVVVVVIALRQFQGSFIYDVTHDNF